MATISEYYFFFDTKIPIIGYCFFYDDFDYCCIVDIGSIWENCHVNIKNTF